ncbi:hypothetical protein [Nocardiopsis ganjiahuensis]|uniref:hypothetical protein n=1 Tax=Nocardiopsis ganjiahuensis TaxID=239984 RepID=UPI00034B354A|nr:hypothetical protein [Nocardiopsis ganjiahuensis]
MLEWKVEARKHARFFGFSLLVVCSVLAAHLALDNTVTEVLWVFAVILTSAAAAAYVAAHLFHHVALDGDLLFHMSTQSAVKKFALKTVPLFLGFCLVGCVTLFGYLNGDGSDGTAGFLLYAYGSKIASFGAFVVTVWVLARLVTRLRGLSTQILVSGVLFVAFVGLQVYGHWTWHSLSGLNWSVGSSTEFLGLPMHANVLAVVVGDGGTEITPAMAGSFVVNTVTVVVGAAAELLLFSRGRSRRALATVPVASGSAV